MEERSGGEERGFERAHQARGKVWWYLSAAKEGAMRRVSVEG